MIKEQGRRRAKKQKKRILLRTPTPSAKRPFSSSPYQLPVPSQYQQIQSTPHHPLQVFWRPWEDIKSKPKLCLSPISPDPPPIRMIRRAKRRSLGDLARGRQRLFSYQNTQAHPFPHTPEPDQSRLESGSWVGGPQRLDWSGMTDLRKIRHLPSPGGPLPLIGCTPLPPDPQHLHHGCPATWLHHLLSIAMAVIDGVTCSL